MIVPVHQLQEQVPAGKPAGSLNCNCAVAAMAVDHATGGAKRPTAWQVRDLCREPDGARDVIGGTNLRQAAAAIKDGWGVDMDVVTPADYAAFRARMQREPTTVASVSVSYSAFVGTSVYASRNGFRANHQVLVRWRANGWDLWDPLADGLRGVPSAPVRCSDALLRKAAGALVLTARVAGRLVSWPLGAGYVYVGYVRGPSTPAPSKYAIRFTPGAFFVYPPSGPRESKSFARTTSAPCEAPAYRNTPEGRRKLARITKGALAGQYVEPGRAHVSLVTL